MKLYDDSKPSKYVTYLDTNVTYRFDVNLISENNLHRYILEIDLEYLDKLQEFHNDYPLAPEKLEIVCDMLSKHCSNIVDQYGIKVDGVNKLFPDLDNIGT